MGINKTLLILLLVLTFLSCQNKPSKINHNQENWNKLSIGFNNSEIIISKIDDIAVLKTYSNLKKSTENSITKHTYTEVKEQLIKISSKDKDSIYQWTKKLINEPFKPKVFCTDFTGKLFLDIKIDEQVTQSCQYNSICDWSKMNEETLKLNQLFKNILKLK